jgi:hypothetical protein
LADAQQVFQRAAQLEPQNARVHNNLGLTLALDGRDDEAAQALRRALALDPANQRAQVNLQWVEQRIAQRAPAAAEPRVAAAAPAEAATAPATAPAVASPAVAAVPAAMAAPPALAAPAAVAAPRLPAPEVAATPSSAPPESAALAASSRATAPAFAVLHAPTAGVGASDWPAQAAPVAPAASVAQTVPVVARPIALAQPQPSSAAPGLALQGSLAAVEPVATDSAAPAPLTDSVASVAHAAVPMPLLTQPARVEATPAAPSLPPARFMVVNGMGRSGAAAQVHALMVRQGLAAPEARLANLAPYQVERSVVHYRAGFLGAALRAARTLPHGADLIELPAHQLGAGDVRVTLGHDWQTWLAACAQASAGCAPREHPRQRSVAGAGDAAADARAAAALTGVAART